MSKQPPKSLPPIGLPGRGPGSGGPGRRFMMQKEKPKYTSQTLKRLLAYIGASRYLLASLLIIMLIITLLSLAGPALQAMAIDSITITNQQLSVDFERLLQVLAVLGLTYVSAAGLTYLQGIFSARLSQTTVKTMRTDLFYRIERLPIRYIDTHRHGDLMSRMTNDVENVSNTISQSIGSLFSSVLTVIGSLSIMLYYSPLLTLVSFISIPLSMFVSTRMAHYMRRYFTRQQMLLGKLNGHVEEMVTGYKTVVAFGKEGKAVSEFQHISTELRNCSIKAQIFGGMMGPLMNLIGNLGFLLIASCGGWLALKGAITVGVIQAFLLYSKQFTRPITEIANQYAQIQTAIAGAERVFEVMDTPLEEEADQVTQAIDKVEGHLIFDHVHFSYVPGQPVLKDLCLNIKSGQKIAIVGATGSGKTTIVNLLTRFYELDSGAILLDGVDIRHLPRRELRKQIAIVLQDTVLFSDTIGANIRYGKLESKPEAIQQAAATANAHLFIERLPKGYETELTEAASNLSGGQRQLLAIARAVLANPKILILDEATSSVDTRTELHIQEAMMALMKNRTSLIIAHRLSTIRDADQIVVLAEGRIEEAGQHEELLKRKGTYYHLYQNQFAGLET